MKKFFTNSNVIMILLALLGVVCMLLGFKVYFFCLIGLGLLLADTVFGGIKYLSKYNQEKAIHQMRKQETFDKLMDLHGEEYAQMIMQTSNVDDEFSKKYLKYKVIGITCIIFSVGFLSIMIRTLM